jgi:hypothetical protein
MKASGSGQPGLCLKRNGEALSAGAVPHGAKSPGNRGRWLLAPPSHAPSPDRTAPLPPVRQRPFAQQVTPAGRTLRGGNIVIGIHILPARICNDTLRTRHTLQSPREKVQDCRNSQVRGAAASQAGIVLKARRLEPLRTCVGEFSPAVVENSLLGAEEHQGVSLAHAYRAEALRLLGRHAASEAARQRVPAQLGAVPAGNGSLSARSTPGSAGGLSQVDSAGSRPCVVCAVLGCGFTSGQAPHRGQQTSHLRLCRRILRGRTRG